MFEPISEIEACLPHAPVTPVKDFIAGPHFEMLLQDRAIDFKYRSELRKQLSEYQKQCKTFYYLEKHLLIADRARKEAFKKTQALIDQIDKAPRGELSEEECAVCMEKYGSCNTFQSPTCQHSLCKDCKSRCDKCPICRASYTPTGHSYGIDYSGLLSFGPPIDVVHI